MQIEVRDPGITPQVVGSYVERLAESMGIDRIDTNYENGVLKLTISAPVRRP